MDIHYWDVPSRTLLEFSLVDDSAGAGNYPDLYHGGYYYIKARVLSPFQEEVSVNPLS